MSQLEPERSSTFHFSSEELIRSCPLPKSLYSHKSRTYKTLTIEASKIEPLSSFLKYNKRHLEYSDMERLIDMIGRQLYHLEVEQNKGISMFHLDDIMVFHSKDTVYFSITNEEHIHDIDDENHMELTIPSSSSSSNSHPRHTSKNIAFYSPEYKEFMSKKSLPYAIHFKSSYYSFGLLCLYCYVTRDISQITHATTTHNDDDDDSDFESLVAPIIHTKIYWFLKHVLRKIPTERRYICV
jgi:hypothetical protein